MIQTKVLALDKAEDGRNVLDKAHLLEHMRSYNQIIASNITEGGKVYKYTDLCGPVSASDQTCKVRREREE